MGGGLIIHHGLIIRTKRYMLIHFFKLFPMGRKDHLDLSLQDTAQLSVYLRWAIIWRFGLQL